MGFISELLAGGADKIISSVGNVLDNVISTKEEKMQLENEIAKAEMQFQLELRKLSIDERRMMIEDTASARNREIQIQTSEQATKLAKNVSPLLALGTVVIVLALFYVLVFSPSTVKGDSKDIVMYILGVLSAVLTQIYSYYFGSSAGSQAKDRTISGMKGPE